jgi:heme oxygenase
MSTIPAPSRLPEALRDATWPLHREVERSELMRRLIAGRFDRAQYVALLVNLGVIYRALEPALERLARHPWLAPIRAPALARCAAIEADLRDLGSSASAAPARAATRYAERLGTLERAAPGLLAAHAYVRYLGDLSGGQRLARVVARTLGLQPPAGLRFYDFGGAAASAALAQEFRRGLASIPASGADEEALVDEACHAFRLHAELFDELLSLPASARAPAAR